jgi:hypothetical protein
LLKLDKIFEIYIREQEQTPIIESLHTSSLIQVISPLVTEGFRHFIPMSPFRWYKALAAGLASVLGIVDPLGAVPTAGISGQI